MIDWIKNHKLTVAAIAALLTAMGSEGVLDEGLVRMALDLAHAVIDAVTGTSPHAAPPPAEAIEGPIEEGASLCRSLFSA